MDVLEEKFSTIPNLSTIIEQLLDFNIFTIEDSIEDKDEQLLETWNWGLAAKFFHFNTNHIDFETRNNIIWKNLAHKTESNVLPPSPFNKLDNVIYSSLPKENSLPPQDLNDVLRNRRTCREFTEDSITIQMLSTILFYCWGMTGQYTGGNLGDVIFKCTPSGGSRHPIEPYFIANRIEGLTSGIYHYDVETHSVGLLEEGQFSDTCVDICSGQEWVRKAPVLFIMTAMLKRSMWKYEHSHAFRVINLDAGHLGQTFHLVCQSLGLGPFTSGASNNRLLEKLLGVNPIEQPVVYLCVTGYPDQSVEIQA